MFKTEPGEFSIDDLARASQEFTVWQGIRNYQARNLLRDEVKKNDRVLIYHSSCKDVGVAGSGKIVRAAYPDPFQFNRKSKYFDAKSSVDQPRWVAVDVAFETKFEQVVSLRTLKQTAALQDMVLLKQGRLSVQPVRPAEFRQILQMAAAG
ncbi:MAG: EVE domain-containing protein [Pseudomonadales bacterium]